jgi:hypothetical protein
VKLRTRILTVILGVVALAIVSLAIALSHNSPCGATPTLPAGTQRMKAIVYRCYGPPDVLKLEEIARPTLDNDRVLVRVHAAAIAYLEEGHARGKVVVNVR